MNQLVQDIVLVILGAVLALVGERLSERYKERKQRQDAFRRLDRMLYTVKEAVGHGHDFKNKADWSEELDALANADRGWLEQLYEPIKRIAWRVRDQSFDHSKPDAEEYCCNELIVDLSLLQLKLLPLIPMRTDLRESKARELARNFLINYYGAVPTDNKEYIDKFLTEWKEGEVVVESKYVMSSVLWTGK